MNHLFVFKKPFNVPDYEVHIEVSTNKIIATTRCYAFVEYYEVGNDLEVFEVIESVKLRLKMLTGNDFQAIMKG